MSDDFNSGSNAQRCPGCGAANDCAIARGEQACWCMVEPIGVSLPTAASTSGITDESCYCQRCLQKFVAKNTQ